MREIKGQIQELAAGSITIANDEDKLTCDVSDGNSRVPDDESFGLGSGRTPSAAGRATRSNC